MKEVHLSGHVDMPTEKIVSLAPSLTETLFFLGLGPKVVGVTERCDYPEEAKEREKVGSFAHPDLEKIRRLKPALVVVLSGIHTPFLDELRDSAIPTLVLDLKSVAGIFMGMEEMARLAGEEGRGRLLVNSLRERVQVARKRSISNPPRVFRLMTENPFVTATCSSYQYDAIRLAGGSSPFLDVDKPYTSMSLEDVLDFDPEVIISCGRKDGEQPRRRCPGCRAEKPPCLRVMSEIGAWEGWKMTSAVREGRVYPIACEFICRPGPRLVEGIERMAELFQSE
ncbi:helical backbone metal receptor [Dehalococcoidia bacterium]|nr:helical backbone metal receptor [Dehalococcoidia bacterium]